MGNPAAGNHVRLAVRPAGSRVPAFTDRVVLPAAPRRTPIAVGRAGIRRELFRQRRNTLPDPTAAVCGAGDGGGAQRDAAAFTGNRPGARLALLAERRAAVLPVRCMAPG